MLGQCVVDRGEQEEASALFTAAVDIRNKCLPANSRKTANCEPMLHHDTLISTQSMSIVCHVAWFELGRCLWLQDVNSQAEAALRAALRIHDQVLERDDPERAWSKSWWLEYILSYLVCFFIPSHFALYAQPWTTWDGACLTRRDQEKLNAHCQKLWQYEKRNCQPTMWTEDGVRMCDLM